MGKRMVVTLALLAGCSYLDPSGEGPRDTGRILFETVRLKMSWGYELRGIYIDAEGLIWEFTRDEPWYPDEQRTSVVRETDLLKKYDGATRAGSVDPRVLAKMVALIAGAADGPMTREPISFERSGRLDLAYTYDSRRGAYRPVFLAGGGEWVARNYSSEARELVAWLREVEEAIGFEE